MELTGSLSGRGCVAGSLSGRGALSGSVGRARGQYPDYQGSYEANALFSEQVFATSARVMRRDFTVHAINYTEAPNDYGTTVTIGG